MTSIEVNLRHLREVVKAVQPFADKSKWLPEFGAIYVVCKDGWLAASATDRYVIGMARTEVLNAPDIEFGLSVDDWATFLKLYPVPRRAEPKPVKVTVADGRVTIDQEGATPRVTVEFELAAGGRTSGRNSYLKALSQQLAIESTPLPGATVNPALLARFAHLDNGNGIDFRFTSAMKPIIVTARNFVGMIMPMRPAERPNEQSWDSLISTPVSEVAA